MSKINWGAMLYELRHQFAPDFPEKPWLNLHPENMADFAAETNPAAIDSFMTDPPIFMGIVMHANPLLPEGSAMLVSGNQICALINLDEGTIIRGAMPLDGIRKLR